MSNIEFAKEKVFLDYGSYFPLTSCFRIFVETMERVF